MKFKIKIPATTANLGLGFDSMGMALQKFLFISAEPAEKWRFHFLDQSLNILPRGEDNLLAKTAIQVAERYGKVMPSLEVEMASEIPLTHGLGSSSSAIVAGVELANHFCQLNLSDYDKVKLATQIEGHPDNVGPCVTGGVFVGAYHQGDLAYESFRLIKPIGIILSVPQYELETEKARGVLPTSFSRQDAVNQNALNNVALLALLEGNYQKAGRLMMEDKFHEPYRMPLIKEFGLLKKFVLKEGAYASLISGAGPTILTLCPLDQRDNLVERLQEFLPTCAHEAVELYDKNRT